MNILCYRFEVFFSITLNFYVCQFWTFNKENLRIFNCISVVFTQLKFCLKFYKVVVTLCREWFSSYFLKFNASFRLWKVGIFFQNCQKLYPYKKGFERLLQKIFMQACFASTHLVPETAFQFFLKFYTICWQSKNGIFSRNFHQSYWRIHREFRMHFCSSIRQVVL